MALNSFCQLVLQAAALKLSFLFPFLETRVLNRSLPFLTEHLSDTALHRTVHVAFKLRLWAQLAHPIADCHNKDQQQKADCLPFLPALPSPIAPPMLRKSCGGTPQPLHLHSPNLKDATCGGSVCSSATKPKRQIASAAALANLFFSFPKRCFFGLVKSCEIL